MGWTSWKKIAEHGLWYDDDFDEYTGPACYELAIGGPRLGDLTIVYIGETKSEKERILKYAKNGSHISEIIYLHLKEGWHLYYRATALSSKKEAKEMQDRLLLNFGNSRYPWNTKMPKSDD